MKYHYQQSERMINHFLIIAICIMIGYAGFNFALNGLSAEDRSIFMDITQPLLLGCVGAVPALFYCIVYA